MTPEDIKRAEEIKPCGHNVPCTEGRNSLCDDERIAALEEENIILKTNTQRLENLEHFNLTEISTLQKQLAESKERTLNSEAVQELVSYLKRIKQIPEMSEFDSAPIAQVDAMCDLVDEALKKFQQFREGNEGINNPNAGKSQGSL